jgi:ectoine hydroxylase-related dioxygenase (phytanoyl-CoA dioxygenase family)
MNVLSKDDFAFWREQGYVIVHDAVPAQNLGAVVEAIWQFQEMDPNDSETWYRRPERSNGMIELNGSGMVEMYHHPAMWANRQSPRIHGAFADIWGTEHLWVTIDRCNLNVPNRPEFEFQGFIHWDVDTSLQPLPFDVQGVLSLTDTPPGQGGFQCVPGLPKRLPEWIDSQPDDRNPLRPDLSNLPVKTIETKAGDLLIWNSLLPHGVSPNLSDRPRLAQYLAMSPAQEQNEQARHWRINSWMYRLAPEGNPFPGDPREWERTHGTTAPLTPLGRKLLGLDLWGDIGGDDETRDMALNQERGRTRATPGFGS